MAMVWERVRRMETAACRRRLRHDKVVICWQLKVLLIVQLIDIIN